jgi:hypothetical protein
MINYEIKTHQINRTYKSLHFFVLNKGLNSGRPMNEPCPNCFVVTTQTEKERESLYYLCLSLQIGRYFGFYIKGSVIPFICINDVRKVLNTALQNYEQQQWQFKVEKFKKITVYEENLMKQLKLISDLKIALIRD